MCIYVSKWASGRQPKLGFMMEIFSLVFDATYDKKLKTNKEVVEKYLVWLSCYWSMDGNHMWCDHLYKGARDTSMRV
jgi:hypothetical protein